MGSDTHETSTVIISTAPAEVIAGTDIALKFAVSCPMACDMRGTMIKIIGEGAGILQEIELTDFDGTVNETDEFLMKAPIKLGECAWTVAFSGEEKEGVVHEKSTAPIEFIVKPHPVSMAVWDVPPMVAFGDMFKIKVGVKCQFDCKLTGRARLSAFFIIANRALGYWESKTAPLRMSAIPESMVVSSG